MNSPLVASDSRNSKNSRQSTIYNNNENMEEFTIASTKRLTEDQQEILLNSEYIGNLKQQIEVNVFRKLMEEFTT